MYAHPILPLHDHVPSLTAYRLGRDATRTAFALVNGHDFAAAAAEFRRAAIAAEVIQTRLSERARQHEASSVEYREVAQRCDRWAGIAITRARYAAQCQAVADLVDAYRTVAATHDALQTPVDVLRNGPATKRVRHLR